MPEDRYYKPGSFYRICDMSGFKTRSENTRKEWQGLIVRSTFYEPRQQQDLVTGVRDDQTVPDARPRQKNVFTVLATYVTGPVALGANALPVQSVVGFTDGMPVQVMLDSGSTWDTEISGISGSNLVVAGDLPLAISGIFENQVIQIP